MKRFYQAVSIVASDSGFAVHLDGRGVRTPGGLPLIAQDKALAEAVAGEWRAQKETVDPETMPLTQLLTTAIERVGHGREGMTRDLLAYLDTDLLCYRTAHQEMSRCQAEAWDPWLGWFGQRYGIRLSVTDSLQALAQPPAAHEAAVFAVNAMNDCVFTAFQLVTVLTGSIVLGLAFVQGDLSPDEAFRAANVEEIHKSEIYREDLHGSAPNQERRNQSMRRDLEAARQFLACATE